MGNRAVITTAPFSVNNVGIYLHWNGGRDSVEGFLLACKDLGFRTPGGDPGYAMAYLVSVVGLFFGFAGTSLGIGTCKQLDCDNGENGVYLIGPGWEIVGRKHFDGREQSGTPEEVREFADHIIARVNAAKATREV